MSDLSRRYVGALAVVAVLLLTGGLLLRSRLYPTPVETAPPSEAATLRQLSQEGQLRRSAAYVTQQAAAMAANVRYVAATGASGLWWNRDTLLSSTRARAVVPITGADATANGALGTDSTRRALVIASDSLHAGWVVLVGRDPRGDVISAQFLAGGRATATCDGATIQRYVLGSALDRSFAGAGVFRLDGAALGLIVWCGTELVAVPAHEVGRLLAARGERAVESPLGFRIAAAGPLARSIIGSDTALLVSFVRAGGAADDAGLEAGDVILAIDGRAAGSAVDRLTDGAVARADSLVLTLRRARGVGMVVLRAAADGPGDPRLGVELATSAARPGVPVARIRSGSPAARAGLLIGDRLLRVGSTMVTSSSTADRLLAAAGRDMGPTLLVVAGDDGQHALLVAT